jgi:hypothetical protein
MVRITGSPTAEDVAAVTAVVAALAQRPDEPSPYEHWRRTRVAALERSRVAPRGVTYLASR